MGILLGTSTGNIALTNSDDNDTGAYVSTNNASLSYCGHDLSSGSQTQNLGFVAISVDNIPAAANNPQQAYGFMRFHAQVQ